MLEDSPSLPVFLGSPNLRVLLGPPSSPVLLGSPDKLQYHTHFSFLHITSFLGFPQFFPNLPVLLGFPRQVHMQTVICSRFVAMSLLSNQFSWVLHVYQYSWVHPIYQFSWVPTAYHLSWVPSTSYSFTHISMICRPASVLVL